MIFRISPTLICSGWETKRYYEPHNFEKDKQFDQGILPWPYVDNNLLDMFQEIETIASIEANGKVKYQEWNW